jgi:hypothetical protein
MAIGVLTETPGVKPEMDDRVRTEIDVGAPQEPRWEIYEPHELMRP